MTDIPILMSAPMVCALIAGRKTMTRRLAWRDAERNAGIPVKTRWQRVKPGDRLWVRETWKPHSLFAAMRPRDIPQSQIFYDADGGYSPSNLPRRSAIHMPRWASRLTMIVTATRIERLQEINEEDAIAEGADPVFVPPDGGSHPYLEGFEQLWRSIHGPDSWTINPEVVAITFRVIKANIDSHEAREAA